MGTPPGTTTAVTLQTGLAHQQAGRLAEAEQVYRQILQQQPNYADALNLLGALLYQQGRFDEAVAFFQRVLTLQPDNPNAFNSVGVALKGQGQVEAAIDYYRQALALQPEHAEVQNNLGNALKEMGDLKGAIAAYEQALAIKPNYPEAHHNLGVILKDQGQLEDAIAHYQAAILQRPNYAEVHHSMGVALHRQGKLQEAIAYHQQAIALKPNYPDAFNSLGNVLQQQSEFEAAIRQHQQAIALKPDYAEAHQGLANALQQVQRFEEAMTHYHKALELRPHYPEAYNNLGNVFQEQGDTDAAIAHYQRALELRPQFAEAYSNLGAALKDQKKFEDAIAHFQKALEINADYAEVHNNLGNVYQELGRYEAAIACYRAALVIKPDYAEIHSNLGNMLQQRGEFELAFEHFRQAIAAQPDYAGAYNNWGIALRNHLEIEAAFAAYDKAIELNPDFVEAQWNKALTQLLIGELQTGFAGYEWRLQWSKFQEQNPPRPFPQPRWDGSPLNGKTILLYAEQGMGDTIQFIRYAALVAQQGGRTIVECHPPLVTLLQGVAGVDRILPYGAPLPNFDVHAPLMSLPYLLGTTLETVPADIPYIPLPPIAPVSLPPTPDGLKIGIVWSGNPQNPYNRTRTCPLELLLPLADLPGLELFSLQKDLQAADVELLQAHPHIHDLRALLTDFVATAALIDQLDLVIAVDTAVAHLAGAIGKPVWLLLPLAPDWRWMLEREESPWYPTVRLFRQFTFGDWQPVLEQVRSALQARMKDGSGKPEARSRQAENRKPQKPQMNRPVPPPSSPVAIHRPSAASTPPSAPVLSEELKTAVRLYQAGQIAEAEQRCRQMLQDQPAQPDGWHLLGVMLHQQRRHPEAIDCYRQVITLRPDHYDTYNNLGVAFQEQKQLDEAIAHYEKALALKPNYADAHNNYANALREKGQLPQAIHHYRQAIAHKPEYADAYNNLGLALYAQGDYQQAAEAYRQAIEQKPDYAQAHNHLGNALKELGDFEQAARHYQTAIALQPNYAKAYNNWGNIYRDQGDLNIAIEYYDQATTIDPNFAEAHWNKALTLLIGGELQRGFVEYEWRWKVKLPSFYPMRSFSQPLWDGSPLQGKTIFLHAEQGMGDMIQFVRYAPIVAEMGGQVIVECHPPLIQLFQGVAGVQQLVSYGSPPPVFDVHAPLMSLPHILGISLATVPATVPYLSLLPFQAQAQALPPTSRALKVGLVWSGNPENPYNRARAVPLELLLALTDLPGVQFYSLQKELQPAEVERLQAHPEVQDLRANLHNFVDTALLINQLDLVISVDTAVTHLAGALGKPTWLLLPFAPDWRWMLEREDSPWYPTLRLFRQSAYGDWEPVLAQVRSALQAKMADGNGQVFQKRQPSKNENRKQAKGKKQKHQMSQISQTRPLPVSPSVSILLDTVFQLYHGGNLNRAEQVCRQILQQHPDQREAMHALGVILCRSGQLEAAVAQFERVLQLQPDYVEAWSNLGSALQEQGKLEESLPCYQRAIALKPDYADAHQNLAVALKDLDRLEEAVTHCQQAIALKPDSPDIYYNLGFMLRRLGRLQEAIAQYRKAIALKPDFVDAHKNLGHALLLAGDFPNGFAEYEWRWRQKHWVQRPFSQPLWDGSDLHGKTILLHAEQGFGDTMQFIRYAALVRDQGGRVMVECQPELVSLLATATGIDRLIAQGEPLPEFDVHAPLLSLPYLLRTTLDTVPAAIPYLTATATPPPALNRPSSDFKVGIVWAGNPSHQNNRYRSCGLEPFRSLLELPNIRFYSLQKGEAASEFQGQDWPIHDLSTDLQNFADTAAAIAQLDLVITVDTAVAHLAGALGKPVWVLLAFAPDWRWMLDRTDSPWYPSMRLFRQPQAGDWQSVFQQVKTALAQQVASMSSDRLAQPDSTSDQSIAPVADVPQAIGIGWPIDAQTDWGFFGLQLALHLGQDDRYQAVLTSEAGRLPVLYDALLKWSGSSDRPQQLFAEHGLVLKRLTDANQVTAGMELSVVGRRTIGFSHFTNTHLSPDQLELAHRCDRLVASSTWSANLLRSYGFDPMTMFWGVDPVIFHPAPPAKLLGDRFVVFSGGELNECNGQDLTIAAFKAFYERHPDALLVTAWCPLSSRPTGLDGLPETAYLQLTSWQYPDLGNLLRSTNAAVFTNRCSPSTNPLAMASLVCGTPTILSANTGHLDLLRHNLGYPLQVQRPVKSGVASIGRDGWGESDVEEVVETLERIYTNPQEACYRSQVAADFMQEWTWARQIQPLIETIESLHG